MEVHLLIPSQNGKRITVQFTRDETVASFRKKVAETVNIPKEKFLLIAMGKIMVDKSYEDKEATLFATYRVRNKACIFIHTYNKLAIKRERTAPVIKKVVRFASPEPKELNTPLRPIICDDNAVSLPYGDQLCKVCNNDKRRKKCSNCGCVKCLKKTGDPLICDQCDNYWHYDCAGLTKMPTGQFWYCPECVNKDNQLIVGRGKAVKESKPSTKRSAIKLRDTECIIVPSHHVGKIPGIYCGQTWANKSLVHDWGVHRSHRSMAFSRSTGTVSALLEDGLVEDEDRGFQFVYSGTGGGIRTNPNRMKTDNMTHSQILGLHNKALAITCNAPFNEEFGATAQNWRKSRPIRVCRTEKRYKTHPQFAPKEGVRYDGLYKLVKYWPHRVKKSGFIIWKFLFRRDDQELPPWMGDSKELTQAKGLRMIQENEALTRKLVKYNIPARILKMMQLDEKNKRLWDQILQMDFWSEYEFIHYLFDTVVICSSNACSKPIKDPISTPCGHICCVKCLKKNKVKQCFTCRSLIPRSTIVVNDQLTKILRTLNWAYNTKSDLKNIPLPSTECVKEEEQDFVKKEFEFESVNQVESNLQATTGKQKRKKVQVLIEYLGEDSTTEQQVKRRKCN